MEAAKRVKVMKESDEAFGVQGIIEEDIYSAIMGISHWESLKKELVENSIKGPTPPSPPS